MNTIDKLIATAEAEIGYLEKKSNKDLDDKTANAGSNNYTKYNRDLKAWTGVGSINEQWCQAFVDWCFITAFGLEAAKKLIYTWTNYTPTGSNAFKKKGRYIKRGAGKPKRGDVIYFYSTAKGRIGHVGIVTKVDSKKVYTIEGNTSGASSLVTNGGGVRAKSYSLSSTYIDGYGSVDYSVVGAMSPSPAPSSPAPASPAEPREILRNGDIGEDVKQMQSGFIRLGYDLGSWGADGEFGDCTELAVIEFQTAHGLEPDGEFGPLSRAALADALALLEVRAPEMHQVMIEGGDCWARAAPNTSGQKLGVAHRGELLPWQGQTSADGWHLVEYKNQNAWVSGRYGRLV